MCVRHRKIGSRHNCYTDRLLISSMHYAKTPPHVHMYMYINHTDKSLWCIAWRLVYTLIAISTIAFYKYWLVFINVYVYVHVHVHFVSLITLCCALYSHPKVQGGLSCVNIWPDGPNQIWRCEMMYHLRNSLQGRCEKEQGVLEFFLYLSRFYASSLTHGAPRNDCTIQEMLPKTLSKCRGIKPMNGPRVGVEHTDHTWQWLEYSRD